MVATSASSSMGPLTPRNRGRIPRGGRIVQASRRPILLELSENYVKTGYVGQAASSQMILVPRGGSHQHLKHPDASNGKTASASEWYRYYSPILQEALSFVEVTERKVLVLYHDTKTGVHLRPAIQQAWERILLDSLQAPAVAMVSAMKMAALAVAQLHVLLVYFGGCTSGGTGEAHCMVFSEHQSLEFTYQATGVPTTNTTSKDDNKKERPPTLKGDKERWKDMLDLDSPHSVVRCIIQCIQACPREIRKEAIANLMFAGEIYSDHPPKLGLAIARQVRAVLQGDNTTASTATGTPSPEATSAHETTSSSSPEESSPPPFASSIGYTRYQLPTKELRSLAASVGVIQMTNVRPDVLSWLGASVWASHWHATDPESPCFQWKTLTTNPSSSSSFKTEKKADHKEVYIRS